MQSTKQSAKHFFVLSVQRNPQAQWGELSRFEYIDGDKFLTKKAAARHADTARMRWASNYAQFRDAKFRIIDTAELEPVPAKRKADAKPYRCNPHKIADEHADEVRSLESAAYADVQSMVFHPATFDPAALHAMIANAVGE